MLQGELCALLPQEHHVCLSAPGRNGTLPDSTAARAASAPTPTCPAPHSPALHTLPQLPRVGWPPWTGSAGLVAGCAFAWTAAQPGHGGSQHLAGACSSSMCRDAGAPGVCTIDDGVQVMGVAALRPPGALLLHKVVADGRIAVPRVLQADTGSGWLPTHSSRTYSRHRAHSMQRTS